VPGCLLLLSPPLSLCHSTPTSEQRASTMEALTKSNGSGSAPKRQGKVQAESTRRKMRKKEEDIKMDIWLRLPQELIWEILCFVVGSYPDHNHQKCFTRCFKSTLASKLELKKKYETGQTISESEFTIIEYRLACPIWGIGHLSQVNVNFEMHHCECSLPSSLHQTLNKPSKVTIGQLTLTDSGIRRWKKTMYGAKVVIKNFGQVKENASKESSNGVAAKESEDEGEEEDPKVCYNGHE
jgi:hypothetical protein